MLHTDDFLSKVKIDLKSASILKLREQFFLPGLSEIDFYENLTQFFKLYELKIHPEYSLMIIN